jgi:2-polyprenyl-3-methyl-5-hydroxy-6-metoxy-1,4-benzoquinol methylase
MNWECKPIEECIACGSKELVPVLDLNSQPLANSFVRDPYEVSTQQMFPLAINRCAHCYHVQLTHQVNPEMIFKDYAYVSGTAVTSLKYFDWLIRHIMGKYISYGADVGSVLDIGCNDGSFLNACKMVDSKIETYGVDPAENLYALSSKHHDVHCGFFTGNEFEPEKKFDVITCLNAFAHNSDQLGFLKNAATRMHDQSLLICSTSQADMILNGEFDTIYHEHLSYYNTQSAREICTRAGLHLIDVWKNPIHGTSYIFVISKTLRNEKSIVRVNAAIKAEQVAGLYTPETYEIYAERCYKTAEAFAKIIRKYRDEGILVIGYGACAKGNTLMNFANEGPRVILDDNPLKQNTYTPGLGAWVIPSTNLLNDGFMDEDSICFVPLAWNFYEEIVDKIKALRPESTYSDFFIRYYPEVTVDEGDNNHG